MSRKSPKRPNEHSPKNESKHSRYYASHWKARQAQSRAYYHWCKDAHKTRKTSSKPSPLPLEKHMETSAAWIEDQRTSMYQEFLSLRNSVDDWMNRSVPQFPILKHKFSQQLPTHLFSGTTLSNQVHVFLDRYLERRANFADLDIWHFYKGICSMQRGIGSGRARLVYELAPQMVIPQPSWGASTSWVRQDSADSTQTIFTRVLQLRARTNRLIKISSKMQRYRGDLVWRYGEVEECVHSGRALFMEWYTLLDDLDEDLSDVQDLCMLFKEVSRSSYELGQVSEYFIFLLSRLPKK
ncbi:hypothetical protein GYMLUDRAFT_247908 [Collybiopsis luxurians FD-317 M1]|uniref:Uncharacterized protein n=1 Tax=Collybiopsis luxurians FD-317 M1 TaxID=944289 RepID=A0A0D0BN63_9AGAR|nr:hypothetical protein GYMLUDRAFT_247908 [Collybiopsis luxurians FD-317 M1]